VITSRQNETLKLVRKLHERRWREKLGLFAAEGEDLVEAAAKAGLEPVELLVAGETVEPELLAEVSTLAHPPRVLGVYRRSDLRSGPLGGLGVGLWKVVDPGNIGTLLRCADAFAPAFVAFSEGCADPTGPKALRASAGAIFRVPVGRLEEAPKPWLALVARGGTPLAEAELPVEGTFLLGGEREGLPEELVTQCYKVSIPMSGAAESLNVAVAGAVALYEAARTGPKRSREPSTRTTSSQ
jgi:TrmH family RNA methyltransferase